MTTTDTTPSDANICRAVGWKELGPGGWITGPKTGRCVEFKSLATDLLAVIEALKATGLSFRLDYQGYKYILWWLDSATSGGWHKTIEAAIHAALCKLIESGWRRDS